MKKLSQLSVIAIAVVLALAIGEIRFQWYLSHQEGMAQSEVVDHVSEAIVGVVATSRRERGEGSGVVYKVEDGHTFIVTNEHVIHGADALEIVFSTGLRLEAEVVGSDIFTDLALLQISDFEAPTVAVFGNTEEMRIGQAVVAVGNPLGLEFAGSATAGIISGHDRAIPVELEGRQPWEMTLLQTDAAINPGNSGGALVNLDGEVIGINSMKLQGDNVYGMNFAIPTYIVLPVLEDLEAYGEVQRLSLGASVYDINNIPTWMRYSLGIDSALGTGIYVDTILPGSLAAEAGFEPGDIIISIGDVQISSILQFRRELFTYRPGDEVVFGVVRDGQEIEL